MVFRNMFLQVMKCNGVIVNRFHRPVCDLPYLFAMFSALLKHCGLPLSSLCYVLFEHLYQKLLSQIVLLAAGILNVVESRDNEPTETKQSYEQRKHNKANQTELTPV